MNRSLLILTLAFSLPAFSFDKLRPFTAKLEKKNKVQWDQYELPFLHVVTGVKFPEPAEKLRERLRLHLIKRGIRVRTHVTTSSTGELANPSNLPLPKEVVKEDQLRGIQKCDIEECKMKMSNRQKPKMQSAKDKVKTYQEIVIDRVNRFLIKNELDGYEERLRNEATIGQMLRATGFFASRYPKEMAFFERNLWKGDFKNSPVLDSFLRSELLVMAPDRMQPIWRISEVFESKPPEGPLFVELHIYTNHYFDASLRIFEIRSMGPGESVLVVTDIMEIDELKKSAFIRALYTGKMVEAVVQHQEDEIELLKDKV